jgi:uncharacterized membrane protein YhaH (DUF805 family)
MSKIFLYHAIVESSAGLAILAGIAGLIPSMAFLSARTNQHHQNIAELVALLMISSAIGPFYCYVTQEDSIGVALSCFVYHALLTAFGVYKMVRGRLSYGLDPLFTKLQSSIPVLVAHGSLLAGFAHYLKPLL